MASKSQKVLNANVSAEGGLRGTKGFLKFTSMISAAVKLYKSYDDFAPGFKQVHAPCGSTINQKIYCPKCDKIVENKQLELTKAIEDGDRIIPFNEEELDEVKAEASNEFEIEAFVDEKKSGCFIRDGERRFIGADPTQPCDAYRVFFAALVGSGLVGVVHYTRLGFEHQAILTADKTLGIFTLEDVRYADDIRDAKPVPRPISYEADKKEVAAAREFIDSMKQAPEAIGNNPNAKRLEDFRARKIAEFDKNPLPQVERKLTIVPNKPKDLMTALKASLAEKKGGKKKAA